jgi:hypothetical protein
LEPFVLLLLLPLSLFVRFPAVGIKRGELEN